MTICNYYILWYECFFLFFFYRGKSTLISVQLKSDVTWIKHEITVKNIPSLRLPSIRWCARGWALSTKMLLCRTKGWKCEPGHSLPLPLESQSSQRMQQTGSWTKEGGRKEEGRAVTRLCCQRMFWKNFKGTSLLMWEEKAGGLAIPWYAWAYQDFSRDFEGFQPPFLSRGHIQVSRKPTMSDCACVAL